MKKILLPLFIVIMLIIFYFLANYQPEKNQQININSINKTEQTIEQPNQIKQTDNIEQANTKLQNDKKKEIANLKETIKFYHSIEPVKAKILSVDKSRGDEEIFYFKIKSGPVTKIVKSDLYTYSQLNPKIGQNALIQLRPCHDINQYMYEDSKGNQTISKSIEPYIENRQLLSSAQKLECIAINRIYEVEEELVAFDEEKRIEITKAKKRLEILNAK